MKRSSCTTKAVLAGLALAGALPWALASCATTEEGSSRDDTPRTVLEAGTSDGNDAGLSDGGVDADCPPSDPMCVPKPISCEEAAWCPVPTKVSSLYALTAIWGSGKDDVWASGSGGTVIHWDGSTWTPTPLPTESGLPLKNTFHALWGSGPNDIWVASATNLIFHTDGFKNGTATWTQLPNAVQALPVPLYAAWGTGPDDLRFGGRPYYFSDPDHGLLVANQIIKKRSEAGVEWTPARGAATIHGLWGSSPDDVWLIGDNRAELAWQIGLAMHGTRQGDDFIWTEVDSRASVVLRGIWGSSASDVWAVGDRGTIRRFGPKATEWEIIESPTTETLHAVWGTAADDVWDVGESGTILHWDGASWTTSVAAFSVNPKRPHLYGIWGSGPTDVWIVGEGIALRYTGTTGGSK
ncbi:MAG: hypothetical protein J0I07_08905 [Myxococcales bacterium]|nr:hypothetical protein [Myxococcales bacterium]